MTARSVTPVLAALIAASAALSCHSAPPSEPPPVTDATSETPETPQVIEWFLGERVRGVKTSNHGLHLGVLTAESSGAKVGTRVGTKTSNHGAQLGLLTIDATRSRARELASIDTLAPEPLAKGTPRPGSCAPSLVSFIPEPARAPSWLGVDESGRLLRYSSTERWAPVPTKVALPRLVALLGFDGPRLLVVAEAEDGHREQLAVLRLSGTTVTELRTVEPAKLREREATLRRYASGRCLEGGRDCLRLTSTDDGIVLSREPRPHAYYDTIASLGDDGVKDVRYADATGTKIDVLTTRACEAAAEPSAKAEASP